MLSAGLAYAHGMPQPIGPVLATDLSPHTVIYSAGQWKLLLLGSKTQHLLAEVRRRGRLEICQNIYTTKFSCVRILHIENA